MENQEFWHHDTSDKEPMDRSHFHCLGAEPAFSRFLLDIDPCGTHKRDMDHPLDTDPPMEEDDWKELRNQSISSFFLVAFSTTRRRTCNIKQQVLVLYCTVLYWTGLCAVVSLRVM